MNKFGSILFWLSIVTLVGLGITGFVAYLKDHNK